MAAAPAPYPQLASAVPISAQVTVVPKRVTAKPRWVTLSGFVTAAAHPLGHTGRESDLAAKGCVDATLASFTVVSAPLKRIPWRDSPRLRVRDA